MNAFIPVHPAPHHASPPHPASAALVEQLQHELAARDETIAQLRAHNTALVEHQRWQNEVCRVPYQQLSATNKLALLVVGRELRHKARQAPDAEDHRICVQELAKDAGISDDSMSKSIQTFEACALVRRRHETGVKPSGEPYKHLHLKPLPTFKTPAQLLAPEPRNHGGKRTCKCGGELVLIERTYACRACGELHQERVHHAPDAPDEDTKPPYPQVAGTGLITNERGAIAAYPHLAGTVAWLVELAGEGTRHIEMQRDGANKYAWRDGAVTAALVEQHLRGDVVIGATLRRADGQTHMLEWDTDDMPRYAMLEAAAVKLRASGAYVLVEPSPARRDDGTPRGGRLRICFAALVDAAGAHATALDIAPELAAIPEHWPNATKGNGQATRLPFARYRRGAIDAPCLMTFDDGQQLAGLDAARRVFTDERTPATWITPSPAPHPQDVAMDTPPPAPPLVGYLYGSCVGKRASWRAGSSA